MRVTLSVCWLWSPSFKHMNWYITYWGIMLCCLLSLSQTWNWGDPGIAEQCSTEPKALPKALGPWGEVEGSWVPKGVEQHRLWPAQLARGCQSRRWSLKRQHVQGHSQIWTPDCLSLKHVSLTEQFMKHKEPWIPPVSQFRTFRTIRSLSWQLLPGCWVSRPSLFSSGVCCRHSNCQVPTAGLGVVSIVLRPPHWNSIMISAMPLPFLCYLSQRRKLWNELLKT